MSLARFALAARGRALLAIAALAGCACLPPLPSRDDSSALRNTASTERVFVGSMNYDERSAWSNTESGLLMASPTLAAQILSFTERDRNESVHRLQLAADGETVQWVVTGADGKEQVLDDEPHSNWLLSLKMFLLQPFASEDLL